MKLYASHTSPYARKVRVVLAEKKVDYQMIEENVWSPETTIGQFNPLGKVPCLVMEDGGAVFDSRVIAEYADTLSPVGRLIPQGSRERLEVRCWEALADGLLDAALLVRLETTQREEGQRSEQWVQRQRDQDRRRTGRDGLGPGRAPVVHRHPLHPGRCGRGLRAGLSGLPFPEHRLARAVPEPRRVPGKRSRSASRSSTPPRPRWVERRYSWLASNVRQPPVTG